MIHTNNHKLPEPLFNALLGNTKNLDLERIQRILEELMAEHHRPRQERMSVTALCDSPLIRTLLIEHWDELVADASEYFFAMFGRQTHLLLAIYAPADAIVEEKLEDKTYPGSTEIDAKTIVGVHDLYYPSTGSLEDWKTTSVWQAVNRDDLLEKVTPQLNVYAWQRLRRGQKVMGLFANILTRDWSRNKVGDGYPVIPFKRVPVELWSLERTQKYIEGRLHRHAISPRGKCSPDEMWESPTQYAVMKKDRKSALRVKGLFTREMAQAYINSKGLNGSQIYIEKRPGRRIRCESYCPVSKVCPYIKQK